MKPLFRITGIVTLFALVSVAGAADYVNIHRELAAQLVAEEDWDGAAIEYRRLAMGPLPQEEKNGYRWLAAYYYLENEQPPTALNMLDAMETPSPALEWKSDLLRAKAAEQTKSTGEEVFYLESILGSSEPIAKEKEYIARKLAQAMVKQEQWDKALHLVESQGLTGEAEAIRNYTEGKDKSPALGGWLGLIPGMGYAYAGEKANAARSIILNSLFIYGMVHTAQEDQWGAFTAITFFEITWYTGSIYGGIDASHRYNRKRREGLLQHLSGSLLVDPDADKIPAIQLKLRF